jgi:hypothetical protein
MGRLSLEDKIFIHDSLDFIVVVKKTSGIETFFSTTVQALMPLFRISVHYDGKRYIG